jgi:hypothetical protein
MACGPRRYGVTDSGFKSFCAVSIETVLTLTISGSFLLNLHPLWSHGFRLNVTDTTIDQLKPC